VAVEPVLLPRPAHRLAVHGEEQDVGAVEVVPHRPGDVIRRPVERRLEAADAGRGAGAAHGGGRLIGGPQRGEQHQADDRKQGRRRDEGVVVPSHRMLTCGPGMSVISRAWRPSSINRHRPMMTPE